jgi:hypothetical protein
MAMALTQPRVSLYPHGETVEDTLDKPTGAGRFYHGRATQYSNNMKSGKYPKIKGRSKRKRKEKMQNKAEVIPAFSIKVVIEFQSDASIERPMHPIIAERYTTPIT